MQTCQLARLQLDLRIFCGSAWRTQMCCSCLLGAATLLHLGSTHPGGAYANVACSLLIPPHAVRLVEVALVMPDALSACATRLTPTAHVPGATAAAPNSQCRTVMSSFSATQQMPCPWYACVTYADAVVDAIDAPSELLPHLHGGIC
jgi:hypothetical protein